MAIQRKVENDTLYLLDNGTEVLSIEESVDGNNALIKLAGMMRSDTAHDLQDELVAFITMDMALTLDMSKLTYISSTCQQVLLAVQQKMDELGKGSLLLTKMPPKLKAEFDSVGFSHLLDIED